MAPYVELDLDRALTRIGDDRFLMARIMDFVTEDVPHLVDELQRALDDGRYHDASCAAHSLKGLVANVHCEAVERRAFELERLAASEDQSAIGRALPELHQFVDEMLLQLKSARARFSI